jgi:hypothetical protein
MMAWRLQSRPRLPQEDLVVTLRSIWVGPWILAASLSGGCVSSERKVSDTELRILAPSIVSARVVTGPDGRPTLRAVVTGIKRVTDVWVEPAAGGDGVALGKRSDKLFELPLQDLAVAIGDESTDAHGTLSVVVVAENIDGDVTRTEALSLADERVGQDVAH